MKSDLTIESIYDPYAAQYNHDQASSWKGRMSVLDDCGDLTPIIEQGIKDKLSPEIIAHQIDILYQMGKISHRICYLLLQKTSYMLVKGVKRPINRKKPIGGQSIDYRPDISDRVEFGHWEIDCVIGKREGKSACLMILVERKTRYGITILIPKKSKKCIVNALKRIKTKFGKYFYDVFKSITADNGCEFKDAKGMPLALKNGKKVRIYLAHAYHS